MRRLRRRHEALAGPATDRLFLAVLPDAETAGRIAQMARHLRVSHGLSGKPLRPEHFHVTLCHIETGIGLTPGVVESVKASAASVAMPSFRVCFDRAGSFRNGALVLRGDDGVIGLDILQQRLSDALDGEPRRARHFTPHVTLLRDGHRVPEQAIEPIEWNVREVVLVHSQIGRTEHRHIARWILGNA
jgi:2'-5' RNA ligase